MLRLVAALALAVPLGCSLVVLAQSTSASLTGQVTDPSKARIADAKIDAIGTTTNASYETTTNGAGEYYLPSLPPGTYRIEVEKAGFKKLIRPDVILHVQDILEINFEMPVGSATETVNVTGGTPLVDTESATVSTVIDRDFVDNLPLNGRTFQPLIMLTPGVVVTQTSYEDQGQFSVNGQRADGNYFTVDGVSANFGVTGYFPLLQAAGGGLPALSASGGTNSLVSVDAMQEFRVQTSSFAPEFGRTPGGQISVATRSGTNDFHGTLFEYFRNSVLDANDWFADLNHLEKPAERQNDFGGVLGGPIIRDHTFFFFSYEGLRLRLPSTQETVVPDSPSREQAQTMGLTILPYLNAFPIANGAELGGGLAQFDATFTNPSSLDATSIRIDHAVSSRVTLFGRYDYSPSSVAQRGAFPAPDAVLSTTENEASTVQTLTIGSAQSVRPAISNEVRANYSNQKIGTNFVLDNFGGAVPLPNSVLFPSGFSPENANFELYLQGAGQIEQGKNAIDEQRQVNLVDNLSVTKGGHQLKFGVDYRWLSPISSPYLYAQFNEFTGMATTPGGALSDIAAASYVHALQSDTLLAHNTALYGQDAWRFSPRLTLTYGLRWEINPPLKGKGLANQPFAVNGLNDPSTLTLAPRGTPLYQTTYSNLAPRIGIAYQAREGTVLRGGFGAFYDLGYGSLGGISSFFPFSAENTLPLAPFPLSPTDAAPPMTTTAYPVGTILVAEPNLSLPRTYQWNVALEQSLGIEQSFSLTYVGAIGRNLLRNTNLYNPNPNFQFVSVTSNTATSDYDALQAKFERRLSHRLQALASYTWSHSIDVASTDAVNYENSPSVIGNPNIDRGDSDFDIRNSFTAGVTYDIPSFSAGLTRALLGGWSADGFVFARSAPPVDVLAGYSFFNGVAFQFRPDVVPGVPLELYGSQYPGSKIFNVAAFTAPPTGQQGDFGRNVLRGFGAAQGDLAFQRQFQFTEKVSLRFRSEFFNLFNHPNFGPPDNNITDALFGYSTETLASSLGSGGANGGLNPLYQIGGPRSIQFALKL
jgi:hypothetical protein